MIPKNAYSLAVVCVSFMFIVCVCVFVCPSLGLSLHVTCYLHSYQLPQLHFNVYVLLPECVHTETNPILFHSKVPFTYCFRFFPPSIPFHSIAFHFRCLLEFVRGCLRKLRVFMRWKCF